jgi:hypothetical protein
VPSAGHGGGRVGLDRHGDVLVITPDIPAAILATPGIGPATA